MSLQEDWDASVPIGKNPGGDLSAQWEKAKPITFNGRPDKPATKAPVKAPHGEITFGDDPEDTRKNLLGAATEPLLSMGSGAIAGPLSGLAGIAGTMLPGPPGQGADWTRRFGDAFTYSPRSEGGQNAMKAFGYLPNKIAEGANWAGEHTASATGSAGLGAGVNAGLQIIPQLLGAKGASMLKAPPRPAVRPEVRTLLDHGVTMTPGELRPGLSRMEEALQSVPVLGDSVKSARGRSVEAFNRGAWNDALQAAGEKKLPDTVKTGNEASAFVREKLGDRYDELLGKMVGKLDNAPPKNALPAPGQIPQPPKPSLRQELDSLMELSKQDGGLPPKELRQLRRIIDKEIKAKFDKSGTAPGDTLKAIRETLGKEEANFRQGGPYERKLAMAIKEADEAVRRMVKDTNPKYADQLSKLDDGYARFKIAQRAAGSVGTREGVFKPSQYDRAVRTQDKSKDHARYSEGRARQQELSSAGKEVLSDTLPDSGTPFRVAAMHLLTNPKALAMTLGAGIPASMLYSPAGIALIQRLLTKPPAVGRAAAMAAPTGAAQAGQQLQPPPQ